MDQPRTYLGIDCGTQGTKALLLDGNGNPLGRGYARHELIEKPNGAREQRPEWWVHALRESVAAALQGHPTSAVAAIGISGQQHGLVVLDAQKQVIRPAKLWNDTETAAQNQQLIDGLGGRKAWFDRFGIIPLTGYTVSKLLWLKQNEPENFQRIRHVLLPHEYLNFYLTGQMHAEYGDASGTGYFDVRTRTWIKEVLDFIDEGSGHLYASLPDLLKPEDAVGTLLPEIASGLHLPADCIVSSGGGDNMMGAIGTGNVSAGTITISLGTSSTVYGYRDAPVLDPTGNVAPFCSSTGGWLPLVCTMNATNVTTQTVELLGKTVAEVDTALANTPPGAEGLVFHTFLNGERTPDLPTARGTLSGIASTNFTSHHLVRAAIEGVSFAILNGLDLILQGNAAQRIVAIGGGAKSTAWRQLLADATGVPIVVPTEEEAGCLGAAIQAIYLHRLKSGTSVSFSELTDQLVKLDESRTLQPNASLYEEYKKARQTYREQLFTLYPAARPEA